MKSAIEREIDAELAAEAAAAQGVAEEKAQDEWFLRWAADYDVSGPPGGAPPPGAGGHNVYNIGCQNTSRNNSRVQSTSANLQ